MPRFAPTTVEALVTTLADQLVEMPGRSVVAVDGSDAAEPVGFAETLAAQLRGRGRDCGVVSLHDFVRPASLRLEYGKDELSYRTAWFDYGSVDREVLQALRIRGQWLPALWDEARDRSARATMRTATENTVVIVAGPMLLGRALDFDLTVELQMSEAALRRLSGPDKAFVVEALLLHRLQRDGDPDFLVAWDHPDRPALRT